MVAAFSVVLRGLSEQFSDFVGVGILGIKLQSKFELLLGFREVGRFLISHAEMIVIGRIVRGALGGFLQQDNRRTVRTLKVVSPAKRVSGVGKVGQAFATGLGVGHG